MNSRTKVSLNSPRVELPEPDGGRGLAGRPYDASRQVLAAANLDEFGPRDDRNASTSAADACPRRILMSSAPGRTATYQDSGEVLAAANLVEFRPRGEPEGRPRRINFRPGAAGLSHPGGVDLSLARRLARQTSPQA